MSYNEYKNGGCWLKALCFDEYHIKKDENTSIYVKLSKFSKDLIKTAVQEQAQLRKDNFLQADLITKLKSENLDLKNEIENLKAMLEK